MCRVWALSGGVAGPGCEVHRVADADANVNLAPEVGDLTCDWLKRQFQQPIISTVPMGWGATRDFIAEVSETLGLDIDVESVGDSRLPWYSRSVDSTYLTNIFNSLIYW